MLIKPGQIVICDGGFGHLVLEGHGLAAVTSTGGVLTFGCEWGEAFCEIPQVFICFDNDAAGREGPPKFNVYLDENLCNCRAILDVLTEHGIQVHSHLEFFQRGTPDDEWLSFVGGNRWALLTTDRCFRYNELEGISLQNQNIQAFESSGNRIGASGMAQA